MCTGHTRECTRRSWIREISQAARACVQREVRCLRFVNHRRLFVRHRASVLPHAAGYLARFCRRTNDEREEDKMNGAIVLSARARARHSSKTNGYRRPPTSPPAPDELSLTSPRSTPLRALMILCATPRTRYRINNSPQRS